MADDSKAKSSTDIPASPNMIAAAISQSQVKSPCQDACPVYLSCHGFISLLKEGKLEAACRLIMQRLPFPRTLGRVCNHPCEDKCRRTQLDAPVNIMQLKRFVTDQADNLGIKYQPVRKDKRKERVAIIGAGPAGLAAAYDLSLEGFQVTVFEAMTVPGGMLAAGAPEFRLPREALRADIDNVTNLGVKIELNQRVSAPVSLLDKGYRAVLIATGSHQGLKLPIPGADLDNVWTATSYLLKVNLGIKVETGNTVLVLGGGDVALDTARSALRLGAEKVGIICLESREDMLADPAEVLMAEEEGIEIYPNRAFIRITAKSGKVCGVDCIKIRSMKFDGDGNPHIESIPGSECQLPAETVIFAVGQVPDLTFLDENSDLNITKRGTISVDPDTLVTNIAGVFAAGDVTTKSGSVAKAIASGQRAALSITMFLNGQELSPYARQMDAEIIPLPSEQTDTDKFLEIPRETAAVLPPALRHCSWNESVLPLSAEQAIREASRCLRCDLERPTEIMDLKRVGYPETLDLQVTRVWENGKANYGHFLRKAILHGLGVRRKLDRADTVIILSCAMPYGMPWQVLSSLKILDILGVEYTFLRDKEYCCGVPLIEMNPPQDRERAEAASADFVKANLQSALALGAKRVAYLCQWCTYAVRKNLPDEEVPQLYFYDLLLEPDVLAKLEQKSLKLPSSRVGYFEGCHLRNLAYAPGVEINWRRFRTLLEMINGIEIIDIPVLKCCVTDCENIVERAITQKLDAIITPCAACWTWLERIGSRRGLPVKMLRDLLAESLTK